MGFVAEVSMVRFGSVFLMAAAVVCAQQSLIQPLPELEGAGVSEVGEESA